MVHTPDALNASIDALCTLEPGLAEAVRRLGYPEPRVRATGYDTLLRTIVGQQVSTAAAASVWAKLEALLGKGCPPPKHCCAKISTPCAPAACRGRSRAMRGASRSWWYRAGSTSTICRKTMKRPSPSWCRSRASVAGRPRYILLFAEGRPDIWPAGDLAVQIAIGQLTGMEGRPDEKQLRARAEGWRPHRSAAAILAWHHYNGATL